MNIEKYFSSHNITCSFHGFLPYTLLSYKRHRFDYTEAFSLATIEQNTGTFLKPAAQVLFQLISSGTISKSSSPLKDENITVNAFIRSGLASLNENELCLHEVGRKADSVLFYPNIITIPGI